MNSALAVILLFFIVAIALGVFARRGRTMNLEQWSVGGRGFGSIFVFVLMAGEIYTTFTFLGGSGWAYGKGAPAFYILCYGPLAYALSYFLLPPIWRYAKEHSLVSQADYFASKFESRTLGVLVAVVSVIAIIPYLVLQLKGLGIIVSEASYGTISQPVAVWTGALALVVFVVVSGIRGSAWTAALKDVMILSIAIFVGVYLPLHYYGSYAAMFHAISAAKPGFLSLPATGMSASWFISTVLLTSIGLYMWPQFFAATFVARDERAIRGNAIMLPLYQLILCFVFFAGFAAVLTVPGLKGSDADLSLLRLSRQTFSPPTVGLIGAAGVLTALVPGSMLLITACTILSKNVFATFALRATERQVSLVARSLVPFVAVIAVLLALRGGSGLVALLLTGYSVVTQLFPSVVASLPERKMVSAPAAFCGIVAGELTVAYLTGTANTLATLLPGAPTEIRDLNVGVVALLVNVSVTAVATLAFPVTRTAVPRSDSATRRA